MAFANTIIQDNISTLNNLNKIRKSFDTEKYLLEMD